MKIKTRPARTTPAQVTVFLTESEVKTALRNYVDSFEAVMNREKLPSGQTSIWGMKRVGVDEEKGLTLCIDVN